MIFVSACALFCAATVSQAEVCRSVVDHRCQEPGRLFTIGDGSLTFVTTVEGMREGQIVRHVWRHNGKQVHSVRLKLGPGPAQVQSVHAIRPDDGGEWTAAVIGPGRKELRKVQFSIMPSAQREVPLPMPKVPPTESRKK